MDLFGEFHKGEIDGKPYLLYHNVMKPSTQTHTSNSSAEKTTIQKPLSLQNKTNSSDEVTIGDGDNLPISPIFICLNLRLQKSARIQNIALGDEDGKALRDKFFKLETSPLQGHGDNISDDHVVLPLFWCNNKEADPKMDCNICRVQKAGTNYYYCVECDVTYHKECIESPLEISYPTHAKHTLQLCFSSLRGVHQCIICKNRADLIIYYCALCDIYMHAVCAQAAIPFFIDQPKRHDHTLSLFPRQASLTCNVCALVNKLHLTYVCRSICDFVAHSDCIHVPQTIRISRHHHRVSFTSSLPLEKWSCGVCRREVDHDYGAYTCCVCSGYAVHTRCALRTDIWDGIELEGVQEDEDVEPPFKGIAGGTILHFSHGCQLEFKTSEVYDQEKFCQACALPIYEKNFYECVECDFILHERCVEAPRKKVHPLHPHPLIQKFTHVEGGFSCQACNRMSNSFGYECLMEDCGYNLDVVCASISEPFDYQGHHHPLFLSLDPKEEPICHICRYKHDEHYLTFCRGDEASGADWCELCEGKLAIGGKEGFYKCNECCTTLHINCLLGPEPYMKSGETPPKEGGQVRVFLQRNKSPSRPMCAKCKIRCPYPTYVEMRKKMYYPYFLCTLFHP
ncbi:Cysteine/Histidine-rich C1 domain family protein [Arabidopsis thaliana]|uniref:Cysteine/Histidine-rich C1 domain family protein n=1 Tax=Arabidopsis thaliana TaxID=3702 RepID=F4IR95_ARATH|nr:Cysteine/Histidine-rich C1 domain family protein [Arabidopsis thaliana]AEC05610.1 Cysteine/Histidine-rich C1 domain family protein [Arabidopsis thaliana]|eukprot:NP_178372.2 Cysteine/Histidine-rich C1 domain family protein [Arabidopsis thaliana]